MDYNDFQQEIREITSVQDLVDAFVIAHNTVGCISDLVYDYEEGSNEYKNTLETVEQWEKIGEELEKRTISKAQEEKLLDVRKLNSGTMKQIERFMAKYGYRDAGGWWIKKYQ